MQEINRKFLIKCLLSQAKQKTELDVRAHRYALRQLATSKRANGDVTDNEFFDGYHALVKQYVNNLTNW